MNQASPDIPKLQQTPLERCRWPMASSVLLGGGRLPLVATQGSCTGPACSPTALQRPNLPSFSLQKCNPIIRNLWLAVRVLSVSEMKNVMLRSIAYNYPGFQLLPRGIKKMLLFSESFFFSNENSRSCANLLRPLAQPFWVPPLVRAPVSVAAAWRN